MNWGWPVSKRDDHIRHSRHVTRGQRWKALRMQALDRDGWQCVQCGSRRRLECDHVEPVRTHPQLAYVLSNIQVLCAGCHSRKTAIEVGFAPLNPPRQEWRNLLRMMQHSSPGKQDF